MHKSVLDWLSGMHLAIKNLDQMNVLEVGSYDENGSPRTIFEKHVASYVGVDKREGRGVDKVADANGLPFEPNEFDLVISTEMLEHDPLPWLTFSEFERVLRPGGHLLVTARGFDAYGGYPEHPCPNDYWRFNTESFKVLMNHSFLSPVEVIADPEIPGVFGHAVKPSR